MWPQRWLGEALSRLYWSFGSGTFSVAEAARVLNFQESKIHVAFSKLHASGALLVFDRGRPRSYRLLDPRNYMLLTSGGIAKVEFKQEEYAQLAYDVLRTLRERIDLSSFCVYGSVARGRAGQSSDLDVLLVSDDFRGSLASRIDGLSYIDDEVGDEIRFLRKKGLTVSVSLMPFRKEEVLASPILLLGPAYEAVIPYDGGGFLTGVLARLRARLDLAGSRRVETEGGGWYWDLKPDFKRGQEVVI